jgi:hypothetical protein
MLRDYSRAMRAVVYSAYKSRITLYPPATCAGQLTGGLRENASSLSCGVSADIRSTHSAEK